MDKKLVIKLQIFTFIISASSACFGPFLPVYFNDRRLTFSQIGIAFALNAIIAVTVQPIWGYISDKYLNKKKTLFMAIILNMIMIAFFIKAQSFGLILLLIILNNVFMSGIPPIIDAYTFDVIEEKEGLSYSHFRFMASAAWGLTNLGLGYVIKSYGINYTFIIYEIFAVVGLILLYSMHYEGRKNTNKLEFKDVSIIFKNIKLVIFFITIFLMNAAFIGGVNYMNELVKYTGGDVSKLGIVWFVTCTFEVLTFYIAGKLINKLGVINIYIISVIVYGSKFMLDFFFKNANIIIGIQVLEGIAFTLFITSTLEYLNLNTDSKVRATAMSTYAAFGGLGAFTSSLLGGFALNRITPSALYGVFGGLCFCALGGIILLSKIKSAEK